MKRVPNILAYTTLITFAALTACQTTATDPNEIAALNCDNAPLPELTIQQPSAEVPKDISRFSGTWKGKWDGILCSRLAIISLDSKGVATGVYAWASGSNFNSGNSEFSTQITDGELKFGTDANFTFSFAKGSDEVLLGRRQRSGGTNTISMVRN